MVLRFFLFLAILLFSNHYLTVCSEKESPMRRAYIVHVRSPQNIGLASLERPEAWYRSFLPKAGSNSNQSRIIYSYNHAISGFAARLTEEELKEMAKMDGFLKAYPDRTLDLHTTHTPAFLGLQPGKGFWEGLGFGKGVIIGILDTGVSPLHPSFDDHGMAPPPPRWKGACLLEGTGGCNNKLIGLRDFASRDGPLDDDGHGTHTASTAAGNFVSNAEVLGNANGTASGMAPGAHLAVYKVCSLVGCVTSAVLAGIDAAIEDGVDLMSISLGGSLPRAFSDDSLAIATFAAAEKGIFVSCSAGNWGPKSSTVTNGAPWVLTVAANTIDRNIRATVKLGHGEKFNGQSVFQPDDYPSNMLSLVLPDANNSLMIGDCMGGLNVSHVKGKMVLCILDPHSRIDIGDSVKAGGGVAMILMNDKTNGYTTFAEAHLLPASHVSYADGSKILSYINSSSNPTASISFKGTIIERSLAPCIAAFSSRGPNWPSLGILKPDITGPGVSILAAWPFEVGPPGAKHGKVNFNVLSGTSMSTPHLSGIAALVKSAHPDWSPAAIKSAIMTTADTQNQDGEPMKDEQLQPASFFAMGAGQVNPSKAVNPGLVYDIDFEDYISYLCGLNYTDQQVEQVTRRRVTCAEIKMIKEEELNYPSIVVSMKNGPVTVNRTVTNVGESPSTYKIVVEMPEGASVTVVPETLQFSKVKEKKSFEVSISVQKRGLEGSLKWVSENHVVKTPIVILADG